LGATMLVIFVTLSKIVGPKLPVSTLVVPGPIVSGDCQSTAIVLLLLETMPPVDMPTNSPVALSVVSSTTKSNVKASNCVVWAPEQVGHTRRKSPRSMLDGTPLALVVLGTKVSVAPSPNALSSVRPPFVIGPPEVATNSVPAEFVV